ncbi:MAG: NAD(P)/FAD-dependent oxidoreductase [Bacteroidia bacterium]|nr:NAD(P)/FAD-dependent oxidoreductase [Bacteroidia bacterium]
MNKYDIIVIGSGLGGLICAYILSKEGYNVCVIEKHNKIGGCLQTFVRDGCIFDTGVHYVGGLDYGKNLYQYFKYFDLTGKINIRKMDNNFDHICFNDNEYFFSFGHDNFADTLAKKFPSERKNLFNYVKQIKEMSLEFPLYNLREIKSPIMEKHLYRKKAYDFIQSVTSNQQLQNILAGTNILYAGVPSKTPLYVHALINNSNIEGSWRFVGGSEQIAYFLTGSIRKHGGTVLTNKEAKKFIFKNRAIQYIQMASGEKSEAKKFISAIHPVRTLEMIEKNRIREAYRSRINSLENSISMFALNIVLKENSFAYMNYNIYYYAQDDVWVAGSYNEKKWPQSYTLITPATTKSEKFADCMTILTYMKFDEVREWENTTVGKRGNEYLEFKQKKAEKLLDIVEQRFPGLRKCIKSYYTSTPLTFRDYTGTKNGAIYGIQKDSNDIMKTLILPKTKIPNLYLTGQNTNLHGVLGVTISAILTCAEFIDINYLIKKIQSDS